MSASLNNEFHFAEYGQGMRYWLLFSAASVTVFHRVVPKAELEQD